MRWAKRIAGAVLIVAAAIALVVIVGSEVMIRRGRNAPLPPIAADRTPAAVAEGARVAGFTGCVSCHGQRGEGHVMLDSPMLGRIAPPALARVASGYSDAELARLIRFGVKRDGRSVFIMPTEAHRYLADDDVARLIGWLRTLHPSPGDETRATRYGPVLRAAMVGGGLKPAAHADDVSAARRPADIGGYIVHVSCSGCHQLHAPGMADPESGTPAPALAEVGPAYDPALFRRLLRTGVDATGHPLGLMKEAVDHGIKGLHDNEIAAIQTYLAQQAGQGPARD